MTNGDPTRSELYSRRWFYDELLDRLENESIEIHSRVNVGNSLLETGRLSKNINPVDQRKAIVQTERYLVSVDHNLDFFKRLHPFIIGPATIESLIEQTPTNYDHIRETRLPFNEIFFEFLEPINFRLPFYNKDKSLRGIALSKPVELEDNLYWIKLYCSDSPREIVFISIFRNLETNGDIQGKISTLNGAKFNDSLGMDGVYIFRANIEDNILEYTTHRENDTFQLQTGKSLTDQDNPFISQIKFSDMSDPKTFNRISNLCVNLVNYINAHNVTVVTRERQATYLSKRPNGKNKKRIEKRQYNLIVVEDSIVYKNKDPADKVWELDERIFVRGHNRRLPYAEITAPKTLWIPPHIKGPEGAPFKEQRYQVLYQKLAREIAMFRDLGLRHDSELWMER